MDLGSVVVSPSFLRSVQAVDDPFRRNVHVWLKLCDLELARLVLADGNPKVQRVLRHRLVITVCYNTPGWASISSLRLQQIETRLMDALACRVYCEVSIALARLR